MRGVGFVSGNGIDGLGQTVRSWITRIRKAFRDVDPDFDRIEVRTGFGYRWCYQLPDTDAALSQGATL